MSNENQVQHNVDENIPELEVEDSSKVSGSPVPEAEKNPETETDGVVEKKQEEGDIPSFVVQPNVIIDHNIMIPIKERGDDSVTLPSGLDVRAAKSIAQADHLEHYGSNNAVEWAQAIQGGVAYNTIDEVFVDSLKDPEKEFRQVNHHNGMELTSGTPRQRVVAGQQITGEPAVMRMMSRLSLGVPRQIPLWHSGMWITFKPPVETDILDLARQISSDKIVMGRESYSLMYSNLSAVTMARVVEFALNHVLTLTVGNDQIPADKIRSYISCLDAPAMISGIAQTMFPKGFHYSRACINNPGKCTHTEHGVLNIFKMNHSSTKTLTDWQRTHMAGRQPKIKKVDDITRYQSELIDSQKRRVVLNEGEADEVAFVLRVPSIEEYIDSGYNWINNIVANIEKVMAEDPSIVNRNTEIMRHGRATAMRQYTHWVESIEEKIVDKTGEISIETITDRPTIEKNLEVMSTSDEIRTFFMDEVVKFINKATIDVFGIPVYECTVCGTKQQEEKEAKFPQHVEIIPLDALQLFFTLISKKVNRIDRR